MNLINVENITKSYTGRKLFSKASFYVQEHEKIGIIGINGTGKSTLLKIVAGLETPDEGKVTIANHVVINYLPQNPDFDGEKTILEQAMAGVSPAEQEAKEFQVKNILTRLGLSDYEQKIGVLSGGQKKRVAMAAALALGGAVVLKKKD